MAPSSGAAPLAGVRLIVAAAAAVAWIRPRVHCVRSKSRVSVEKESVGGGRAAVQNVLTHLKRPEPLKRVGMQRARSRTGRLYIEVTVAVCQHIRLESGRHHPAALLCSRSSQRRSSLCAARQSWLACEPLAQQFSSGPRSPPHKWTPSPQRFTPTSCSTLVLFCKQLKEAVVYSHHFCSQQYHTVSHRLMSVRLVVKSNALIFRKQAVTSKAKPRRAASC